MSMPEEEGMVRRKSSFQPKKFLVAGTGNEQRATVAKTLAQKCALGRFERPTLRLECANSSIELRGQIKNHKLNYRFSQ